MAYAFRDVNFIPDEIVAERKKTAKLNKGNKIAIMMASITILVAGGMFGYNQYNESQIKNFESEIKQNKQKIEELKDFGKTGYQLGIRLAKIKEILNSRIYYSKLVEEFTTKIPDSISVNSWQVNEGGSMSLSANSFPNYSPIAEFSNNLKNSETMMFDDVKIRSASLNNRDNEVNFSLQVQLDLEKLHNGIGNTKSE